jgi:hypothetical protein
LQIEDDVVSPNGSSDGSEQLFLAIYKAATTGVEVPRSVKLHGSIQHKPVIILVDSGSSSSFISTVLADQLTGTVPLHQDLKVQVAGGGILCCSQMIPQALWFIGDIAFHSDLRVFAIAAYDVIIGMDWLEKYSTMRVRWKNKWMEIPYDNQTVSMQGIVPHMPDEVLVQLCVLSPQGVHTSELRLFPTEIQSLLDQYPTLFEDPTDLPPSRACDHAIPLIPGAISVNIRQYRYPPALKSEIEQQVADMLKKGPIRPSASLFSSPVLLTKKKDALIASVWVFVTSMRRPSSPSFQCRFSISSWIKLARLHGFLTWIFEWGSTKSSSNLVKNSRRLFILTWAIMSFVSCHLVSQETLEPFRVQ